MTISYELAKQLKEAGFESNHSARNSKYPDKDGYVPPDLEELIEACGEEFGTLTWQFESDNCYPNWIALNRNGDGVKRMKTPSEAVARLWLELNKNKHD